MLEGRACKRGSCGGEIEDDFGVVGGVVAGAAVLSLVGAVLGSDLDILVGVLVGAAVLALLSLAVGGAVLSFVNELRLHTAVDIDPEEPRNI